MADQRAAARAGFRPPRHAGGVLQRGAVVQAAGADAGGEDSGAASARHARRLPRARLPGLRGARRVRHARQR
eukprot:3698010-Pyramimonas_sp.AAC.1